MPDRPRVLISAPVYKRAWILPRWFKALDQQEGVDLGFNILGVEGDEETRNAILSGVHSLRARPWRSSFIMQEQTEQDIEHDLDGKRNWGAARYAHMANLRNELLTAASNSPTDYYMSLDTDILLEDPKSLMKLIKALEHNNIDAVAPLSYMTKWTNAAPNCMRWVDDKATRATRSGIVVKPRFQRVDVIMAAKMMTLETTKKSVYTNHDQGEDIGWSVSMREQNLECGLLGDLYGMHVMSLDHLDYLDKKSDPRRQN